MKYAFLAGAVVGYVFGTRAGRERYEQLKQLSRQVSENPNVQDAAGMLRTKGGEFAGAAKGKAESLAASAKERVPEQMPGRHKNTDAEAKPGVSPG